MSNSPADTKEWSDLEKLSQEIKGLNVQDFFSSDKDRFQKLSCSFDGIFIDYSKQHINETILQTLSKLAASCDVQGKREAMFSGAPMNTTEGRAVLHTALRRPKTEAVNVDGIDVMPDIHETLQRIKTFSDSIRNKQYLGATGKPIEKIVSIGVGGSYLGPRLVCETLCHDKDSIPVYFVSNIDGQEIENILSKCDPETTLLIIISKSFGTQETMTNATIAKKWLQAGLGPKADIFKHFAAISVNKEAANSFGIVDENFFPIWKWVNGRFSLWSAVGLPICIKLGFEAFKELLRGAHAMDRHFQNAPLEKNMPVLMALIGIWNRNFLNCNTQAILPYAQRLSFLPAYIQQLEMESNGKSVNLDGHPITDYKTSPVIFGEVGTNAQHSFYQLLHQGSDIIPSDFIGVINPEGGSDRSHKLLLSNMLAQGQAMMQGRRDESEPHRYFDGNKPNSTILLEKLDAYHLGMLIALYEHKCFVQGVIWNINSFDQFGVELGKELSRKIEENNLSDADSSTKGLFSLIHKDQK